ncbi:MAG: hypothetical protein ACM3VT_17720 [Solirubrobacterales bacterium]
MNGVGSVGSEGSSYLIQSVAPAIEGQTTDHDAKHAGMEQALRLSRQYLVETLCQAGFVDIRSGCVEKLEVYFEHRLSGEKPSQEEASQVELDPAAAAKTAIDTGEMIAANANQVLRIIAQVDPARAAAVLK